MGSDHPSVSQSPGTVSPSARAAVIRILPPEREYRELLSGSVQIRTLVTHQGIRMVEFRLDGTPAQRTRRRPFRGPTRPGGPAAREQMLDVRGLRCRRKVGRRRKDNPRTGSIRPSGVRITTLRGEEMNGSPAVRVVADILMPRSATLERVDFYRSESLVATRDDFDSGTGTGTARRTQVRGADPGRIDTRFRAGKGQAGRRSASWKMPNSSRAPSTRMRSMVQLVQLQVLVVDGRGQSGPGPQARTISKFVKAAWELPIEALFTATDVPLVLGFAIDSSESMAAHLAPVEACGLRLPRNRP